MEVTAAERTTIYTNISPLAQRVNNYIQTQHSSIAAVAKDIGYSRTTVSRYLTGKYDSNPNDLESKLTDFLTRQTGEAVDLTTPLAKSEGKTWQTPVFFESRDAKAVLGVCPQGGQQGDRAPLAGTYQHSGDRGDEPHRQFRQF